MSLSPVRIDDGFEPLPQILFADDFDRGLQGWTLLTGNYESTLDSILPEQRDFRPPDRKSVV